MLKYSSLTLLVVVAISWSQVDAKPNGIRPHASMVKCKADNEISTESQGKMVKELLVGLLLLSADSSAEMLTLSEKYKEALNKEWDSLDEFGQYVVDTYTEVTGKKFDADSEEESSADAEEFKR